MKELRDFKYNSVPLEQAPAEMIECKTSLEYTAWAMQKLLECNDDTTHQLLEKSTDIQRLFQPKIWRQAGRPHISDMFFLRTEPCYAVALYLFLDQSKLVANGENKCCQQCDHINNKGPFDKCISAGTDVAKGACLNCYYSASGKNCSFRKDLEKPLKAVSKYPTEAQRKKATASDLELWMDQIRAEIHRRDKAKFAIELEDDDGGDGEGEGGGQGEGGEDDEDGEGEGDEEGNDNENDQVDKDVGDHEEGGEASRSKRQKTANAEDTE